MSSIVVRWKIHHLFPSFSQEKNFHFLGSSPCPTVKYQFFIMNSGAGHGADRLTPCPMRLVRGGGHERSLHGALWWLCAGHRRNSGGSWENVKMGSMLIFYCPVLLYISPLSEIMVLYCHLLSFYCHVLFDYVLCRINDSVFPFNGVIHSLIQKNI